MSKKINKQAGFTLVEISMAMAIFTFMLLVVSMAYINIARLYNASTVARAVQQNNRFAMEQITRVARTSSKAEWVNVARAKNGQGLCFGGSQLFYLRSLDAAADPYKNELVQASSCDNSDANAKVVSSLDTYAAKLETDGNPAAGTVTISLWMTARKDLLNTAGDSRLTCKTGAGSEFCAINKLTTTVELRGN